MTARLFRILDSDANQQISKKEFECYTSEIYTREIAAKVYPNKPFSKRCKRGFEAGYLKLDKEHLGYVEFDTVKHFLMGHF